MNGYFYRLFLCLLVYTKVLVSYEGSSASQLASIEPEPSAIICGCVHAVTGDFLFQQPDMVVKGAQEISIPRKYYSSSKDVSVEDQILPHRKAFGWAFSTLIHIHKLVIPEPNGMVFSYIETKPRVYRPVTGDFHAGITGYLTDYLGNRYHPANNHAFWPSLTTLLVQTSTGEVRVYEKSSFVNSQPECRFEFRLTRVRLSNGMLIDYEYKKDHLRAITTLSAANKSREFSRADFSEEENRIVIKGSDVSKLEYEYRNYKRKISGQKRKLTLLKHISSSLYPCERLKREEKSTRVRERHFDHGRSLICDYDKQGRVTNLQGPQGVLATIEYENGATTSFDRDGNKTVYLYEPKTYRISEIQTFQGSDQLVKIENYTWTPFGCLEQKTISSGDGEVLYEIHYKYNGYLDLIEKTIFKGSESYTYNYEYNEQHLLREESEGNGKKTTYTYLKGTTLPLEISNFNQDKLLSRTRYDYDEDFLVIREFLDDGNTLFRKEIERRKSGPFCGMPQIISKYCGESLIQKTKLTYDRYGNVTKEDHFGSDDTPQFSTQVIYNDKSQVIKEIDPEGGITEHRYDDNGNLIWKKTPLGLEIHSLYDTANRLIEEKQIGSGQILLTRYEDYDALDHPTKITDPLGGISHRKYDALGNLAQEINPAGHITYYVRDALGNVLSVTDPMGNRTNTTYNLYNKPLSIDYPDGSSETYSYHLDGTKASYTNENGTITLYSYDIFNNLCSEEIVRGAKRTWTYDAFHLLEETNFDGYKTKYAYDHLGRKSKEIYGGRTTHYIYDPLSRVVCEQTGSLRREWTYNKLGHITSEKVYDGGQLTHQTKTLCDIEGNPLEITTYPNNQPAIARTSYDTFGRQISHTTPLGFQTTTAYQFSDGRKVIATHEPGGIIHVETYNSLDQLLEKERKDSAGKSLSKTVNAYDSCGNLTRLAVDTHKIAWSYDNRHRKISETESSLRTTHYTYYPDGKLRSLTKPDGTRLSYGYDSMGHLESLHSSKGDIHYTYIYNNEGHLLIAKDLIHDTQTKRIVDPHGQILEETLANGLQFKSRYDECGRRTQLILPDIVIIYTHLGMNLASVKIDTNTHHYSYDQSGNLIQEKHIDGSTTKYAYDLDSRLTHRKHPLLEETLHYDQRGNLTRITQNGNESSYVYDSFDHIIREPNHTYKYDALHNRIEKDSEKIAYNTLNQPTEFSYDQNGNLLRKEECSFEFDSLDRLVKINGQGWMVAYTYDSDHRRIFEDEVPILWDDQHEMGKPTTYRILGRTPYAEIGSAVAICDQGKVFRPLHTMNGDVFQIQDQSSLKGFTVFGEGETSARWGYRSKVHDPTGLIYFGRRYYDPSSGRFITPDPEGYLDGPNLYTYALNNPLVFHDPYGLFADSLFEVDRWKEIGIAVYHGSVSYARDTTIFAGKYLGGIHGLEDMPFADIYSAHLDANDRFVKKTDDWMASSPYANSDLYHRTHGVTYAGMDIAAGFFFPFGKVKTAASTGKAILKAERIVHSSPTLLKTSQVTGKVFKSSKQGSHYAESLYQGHLLKTHLRQLEKYGVDGCRWLPNNKIRYYGKLRPSRVEGEMAGRRIVREWNPNTGCKRTWHETLDHNGKVRIVRPQTNNTDKIHYFFDGIGKFVEAR